MSYGIWHGEQWTERLQADWLEDFYTIAYSHPLVGAIDWQDAMRGLAESGYSGDLTFEIQEFGRCLPQDMKHLTVELSLEVGKRLAAYYQAAKDAR